MLDFTAARRRHLLSQTQTTRLLVLLALTKYAAAGRHLSDADKVGMLVSKLAGDDSTSPRKGARRPSAAAMARTLKGVDPLKSLPAVQLQRLSEVMIEMTFDEGDYIITQGERGETFYVIVEGRVRCTKEEEPGMPEVELMQLGEGQYFGEKARSALHLPPSTRHAGSAAPFSQEEACVRACVRACVHAPPPPRPNWPAGPRISPPLPPGAVLAPRRCWRRVRRGART